MSDSPDRTGKRCPDCATEKPLGAFSLDASRPDGRQLYCKECYSARQRRYYQNRRDQLGFKPRERVVVPAGHKYCRSCGQAKPHSEWHRNSTSSDGFASYCKTCRAEQSRKHYFKKTYGLSSEDVQRMIKEQFGICPICLQPKPEHVDHDHVTGKVRGVLCFTCNAALGQLRDNPAILRRAARYLEGEVWRPSQMAPGVYRVPS